MNWERAWMKAYEHNSHEVSELKDYLDDAYITAEEDYQYFGDLLSRLNRRRSRSIERHAIAKFGPDASQRKER